MLCDVCNKNEATIHITKIVNGVKKEMNLCSQCAGKNEELNIVPDIDIITPFSFQNILGGLMDYVNMTSAKSSRPVDLVCKNCGSTYREFKEKGLLGCDKCYENFNSTILSVIKGVQSNVEHVGKIPKKSGEELVQRKRIIKLKEELQKSITMEEYEKAAEIRDKIREIEKNKEKSDK
ncbi:UvrB/UvrC motif-containing protein [Clostridium sp. MB40-C1]|uniref:UvrB/UvrC motif-containing protein n=1 Tax=Clostridium sp. MB40-C1 TaxID=3070996 RepID=UPI0027E06D09|nr:UvrB/UvrC motif-containing protein [Clostridium sp. MB40-C1]WMJ80309.1 UvrB/UvrC motif-containing protein [Clostridium sp. MB40-C1]